MLSVKQRLIPGNLSRLGGNARPIQRIVLIRKSTANSGDHSKQEVYLRYTDDTPDQSDQEMSCQYIASFLIRKCTANIPDYSDQEMHGQYSDSF